MTERRALLALLLLAIAAALYIWGRPVPAAREPVPEKAEAAERAKADPFPDAKK